MPPSATKSPDTAKTATAVVPKAGTAPTASFLAPGADVVANLVGTVLVNAANPDVVDVPPKPVAGDVPPELVAAAVGAALVN